MPSDQTDPTKQAVDAVLKRGANIAKIIEATQQVIRKGDADLAWQFDTSAAPVLETEGRLSPGVVLSPSELTVGEMCHVIDETGVGWDQLDLKRDPRVFRAVITAVITARNPEIGGDADKARKIAEKVTTAEFDAGYSLVEKRPADPT